MSLLAFGNSIANGYVYDDIRAIVEHRSVQADLLAAAGRAEEAAAARGEASRLRTGSRPAGR